MGRRYCDSGGIWKRLVDGSAIWEPRCTTPPTHQFRHVDRDGWSYRCGPHVARLMGRDDYVVEALAGEEAA